MLRRVVRNTDGVLAQRFSCFFDNRVFFMSMEGCVFTQNYACANSDMFYELILMVWNCCLRVPCTAVSIC